MADPTPPSPAKDDDDASDGGDEDILKVDLLATLDDALASRTISLEAIL